MPLLSIRINSTYKYELKIVNSTRKNLLNYEKMSSNYEEKWGGGIIKCKLTFVVMGFCHIEGRGRSLQGGLHHFGELLTT